MGVEGACPGMSERIAQCKCRDGDRGSEPGCAVQAAIAAGDIDPERLRRFKKLKRENLHATETIAQSRERSKKFTKHVKRAVKKKGR